MEYMQTIIKYMQEDPSGVDCSGVSGSERAYIISCLLKELKAPVFVIASNRKQGERFLEDLNFFSKGFEFPRLFFPSYNLLPFKSLSYHNETAAKRISILHTLLESDSPPVVVTTIDAVLGRLMPKKEITGFAELLMIEEDIDLDLLVSKLVSGGYRRTPIVEEPGDFSIRGGIVDIFSPMYDDPIRFELFGDIIESLNFFSATSQRKIRSTEEAVIIPTREVILKKESLNEIIVRIREQASILELPVTSLRTIIDRFKQDGIFKGIEGLMPLVYPELDTFFDYAPNNSSFVLLNPGDLEKQAQEFENQTIDNYMSAVNGKRLCVEPDKLYLKWEQVKNTLSKKKALNFNPINIQKSINTGKNLPSQVNLSINENTSISEELKNLHERENLLLPLAEWIRERRDDRCVTIIVCSTKNQIERLKMLLEPYGIEPEYNEYFPEDAGSSRRLKGAVYVCSGSVSSGFVWRDQSLAIITEDEIFGAKRRRRKVKRDRTKTELLGLEDLKKGDFVVHNEHGIGEYKGLTKLKMDGITSDFILIYFRDNDKLYLPVDRMGITNKYVGVDGIKPILDKMGGKPWENVKAKAKKEVAKIAGKLLKLYATRKVGTGHAFGAADRYFRDFEAGFVYEETPDQFKAIEDVLIDMEAPTPMDRLVCGDVGYGKTEVALRASFKAVSDSKQVAMLVPTTVLAEQHFKTFSERFNKYPVNIACLNRFRTQKEQKAIVSDIKEGKVDIIIGTHRLLSNDVSFKDLGLFILDEEQRFGVRHKEKLKSMRKTVDVLALTATPIPRTLHMSLMGVRDISIIATPPEERQAIITYISEPDDTVVSQAIRKELKRNGQIFYIHNNINSIHKVAKKLQNLVPEVKLGVAHGRLKENELDKIMIKFMKNEIDMLVCTTIVESGLDIPSANTILVNRADRFGLSQMYQLRGRVGRADEQAYAYLFIPDESVLTRDAQKRLKVLMEYSDLGSGFQIAKSDLEIRGGGTALGVSQSGRIAAVGYEMFLSLMENAISELKGEPVVEKLEPEINIYMSSFISENYIPDIDQRLSAYRRLSKMTEIKEISDIKAEFIDRYGPLPQETANLFMKIILRVLSVKAGVKRLDLTGNWLSLYFSEIHQTNPVGIIAVINSNPKNYRFSPDNVFKAKLDSRDIGMAVAATKKILQEISGHVNA